MGIDRVGLDPGRNSTQRATFLELFFDLVFVFALTRIGARAFEDLAADPAGSRGWMALTSGGKTLLLLLALWAVWQGTAWTTSRYNPYHIWLQFIVLTALVCSLVLGVTIPRAFSSTSLAFAIGYVVAQVTRPLVLLVILRHRPERALKLRMLITFGVSAVPWIAGALAENPLKVLLWSIALGMEYLAARVGWPVPGLGRSAVSKWSIVGEHLAERYQQFFLVALGETILVIGLAYSGGAFDAARTGAFAVTLTTSILLWRIYIQRAGRILAERSGSRTSRPPSVAPPPTRTC